MVDLKPFCGLRYNPDLDMAKVITPPYDVIDHTGQEEYYLRSPYNIIRLEYGHIHPGDNALDNRYTRAAATLQHWLDEGILRRDQTAAYYLYRQSFHFRGHDYSRTGVLAALKLEPYSRKTVLPHEETLSKPKKDRLQLLQHCRANFSPVFTLFPDPEGTIETHLKSFCHGRPQCDFNDYEGQRHTVWVLNKPEERRFLQKTLMPDVLFIADGHHRYETALAFSSEDTAGHRVLAALFSLHSSDLIVLPTHRILSGLTPEQCRRLKTLIEVSFDITSFPPPQPENWDRFQTELAAAGTRRPSLGLLLPDSLSLLSLKNPPPPGAGGKPLEVTLLRDLIFRPLLGDDPALLERLIGFSRDAEEARQAVSSGRAEAAFLMNPTPTEAMAARARQGEKLPQKTTYFYPKLPSGLVIHTLDDEGDGNWLAK